MKTTYVPRQKDQLTEHYRAIGPASLVAALMAAPRGHSNSKRPHASLRPQSSSRPDQAAK